MNKRISLITAFVMVLILLAACAPQPSQPQATPTPAPAETTPEPTPTDDNAGNQGEDDTGNVTTAEGLEDGVYVGKSDEDERGSYGEIRITVADEQFTKVEYTEYSGDGNPKSRETGYEYEEALEAFEELPKQLMETQDVDDIDDYTGATGTTNKFRTAAKRALSGSPEEGQPAQDNGANENGGVEDDNGVREEDGGTGES